MSSQLRIATVTITNLRLQTIIGCNEWERLQKQDIIINISLKIDVSKAVSLDLLDTTIDYRALKKEILKKVESSSFNLLEKLTSYVLDLVMEKQLVLAATVRIDKPHALRFADSVSIEMSAEK